MKITEKKRLAIRLARIERKCDRILSEFVTLRGILIPIACNKDNSIDEIVLASRLLNKQCKRELIAVRKLYNSKDIQP